MKTGLCSGTTALLEAKRAVIFSLFAFALSFNLKAQVNISPLNAVVTACQAKVFTAIIPPGYISLSGCTLHINADLLAGGIVVTPPCTVNGSGGVNPVSVVIDNVTGGSYTPLVGNNQWSITPSSSSDTVKITYSLYLDCSVAGDNQTIFNIEQKWTLCGNLQTINGTSTAFISNVERPFFIAPSPSSLIFEVGYNHTTSLLFAYQNTGISAANIIFTFEDTSNCSLYIKDSVFYSTDNVVYTYYNPAIDNAVLIPGNHFLYIKYNVRVVDCLTQTQTCSQNLKALFTWRCNLNNIFINCASCQAVLEAPFSLNRAPLDHIEYARILPDINTARHDVSCPGDSLEWQFTFTNTSVNSALKKFHATYRRHQNVPTLSSINASSISAVCIECDSVKVDMVADTGAFCGTNPVLSFSIIVDDMPAGAVVTVSFRTLKCCTADTSLYNQWKYYNHWRLFTDSTMTECGQGGIGFAGVSGPNDPYVSWETTGISTHSNGASADLAMNLLFTPQISHLTVDANPLNNGFGDKGDFSIKIDRIFGDIDDMQLIGRTTADTTLKGILRATIVCSQGLVVDDLINEVKLETDDEIWPPLCYYAEHQDTCLASSYVYYYDLSDTSVWVRNFFTKGEFNFTLQACCQPIPPVGYEVFFDLLLNSDSCSSFICTSDSTPPLCNNCCWIPLNKEGGEIQTTCPGCKIPGSIVNRYNLKRVTYGLEDVNNDRIADGSGNPITGSNYAKFDKLNLNASMHGDVVEDFMWGMFQDGDNDGGYDYNQMLNVWNSKFNVLQIDRTIPYSDASNMNLVPVEAYFYVDSVLPGNPNCIDCDEYNIDTTQYRTILKLCIPASSLQNYLEHPDSSAKYFFTFVEDSLLLLGDVCHNELTSPFVFWPYQRYRLKVRYNVCGNFSMYPSNAIGKLQSEIANNMWFSGKRQESNAWFNVTAAVDTPTIAVVSQAVADTMLFYCEQFGTFHYFYSNEFNNHTSYGRLDDCRAAINSQASANIGNTTLDIFPFEYRVPAYFPAQWQITVPPNYIGDSAFYAQSGISTAVTYQNFTLLTDNSVPFIGCTTDSSNTGFKTTDQSLLINLNSYLTPLNCADSSFGSSYPTNMALITFSDTALHCAAQAIDTITCGMDTTTVANQADLHFNVQLKPPTPNLSFYFNNQVIQTATTEVCWPFFMGNINGQGVSAAPFVYMVVPDSIALPYLDNWSLQWNSDTIQATGNVLQIDTSMSTSATLSPGVLCAEYINCLPDEDTLFFPVHFGWNCLDFPLTAADSTCADTLFNIGFLNHETLVDAEAMFVASTVALCDTLSAAACFQSVEEGWVFPQQFFIDSLAGLTINSVVIYNLINSTTTLTPAPGSSPYNWIITPAMLDSLGFTYQALIAVDSLMNSLCIKVGYETNCNLKDNDPIPPITLLSTSFCGDTLTSTVTTFGNFTIQGNNCTDCFTITKTASIDTAVVGQIVSFDIEFCNNNIFTDTVNVIENLPPNFIVLNPLPTGPHVLDSMECLSFQVTGYYTAIGNCDSTLNEVELHFGGGSYFASDCITIIEDCMNPADTAIIGTNYASWLGTNQYTNKTIFISGTLLIDINFAFNNCTLYMAPGSAISVMTGDSLLLERTEILGCYNMWNTVEMQFYSYLKMAGSVIRDAEDGLHIDDRCYFDVRQSAFNDCVRGIYVKPNPNGNYNTTTGVVSQTKFEQVNGFKPDYQNQQPHGQRPKAGMELHNMIMTIDGDNEFKKLNNGIVGFGSRLTVQNNYFEVMQKDATFEYYNEGWNGAAVASAHSATNASLTFNPAANVPYTVVNSDFGAYTIQTTARISNIKMNNVVRGVVSTKTDNLRSVQVLNCLINATRSGIEFTDNAGSSLMSASENIININGAKGGGILINETGNQPDVPYDIKYNTIKLTNSPRGIYANNVGSISLMLNTIKINNKAPSSFYTQGITLEGTNKANVYCNFAESTTLTDTSRHGIAVSMADNSILNCNVVDSTGWGVFFGGINLGTRFIGNEMKNHYLGLYLNNVAVIDTQQHAGNRWTGTYSNAYNYKAVNWNADTITNLEASLFIVNPGLDSTYNPNIPDGTYSTWPNDQGWFVPASGTTYSCSGVCDTWLTGGGGDEELRMRIANDSTLTSEYVSESKLIAKEALYDELKEDSLLLASNFEFEQFVADNETGSIGLLYEAKKEFKEIYEYDAPFYSSISYYDSLINLLVEDIRILDSISANDSTVNNIVQREALINQINNYNSAVVNLIAQRELYVIEKLDNADLKNSSVIPSGLPEENTKVVNYIYSNYQRNGNESIINDYPNLLSIAAHCPYIGGKAVYRARALLSITNDTLLYDDANVCSQQGIFRTTINNRIINDIEIIPNPAKDKVEIILEGDFAGMCEIQIINLLGEIKINKLFDCDKKGDIINISTLASGAYIVKVLINENEIKGSKLIVIR